MDKQEMMCILGALILVGFFLFRAIGCVQEYNIMRHKETIKKMELRDQRYDKVLP